MSLTWVPILTIEPDGEEECVCIAVSHPSRLYVTEGGILTHNTTVDASRSTGQDVADDRPSQLFQLVYRDESGLRDNERAALGSVRASHPGSVVRPVDALQPQQHAEGQPGGVPGNHGTQQARAGTDFVSALKSVFGKTVLFVESVSGPELAFNGASSPDARNVIVLDARGGESVLALTGHELVHALKAQRPDLWTSMRRDLLALAGDWSIYRQRLSDLGYTPQQMEDEFLGDFLGGQFRNADFWQQASERNPTLFGRLARAALDILDRLLGRVSSLSRDVQGYFADLRAARDVVIDALEKYAQGPMPERVLGDAGDMDYSRKATDSMRLVSMRMSQASADLRAKIKAHKATTDERTIDGERIEEAGYLVRKDADMMALADEWLDGFLEVEGAAGRTAAESRETLRRAVVDSAAIGGETLDVDVASVIMGRLIEGRHYDLGLERSEVEAWAQRVFSQAGYALRQAGNIWDPLTKLVEKADADTGKAMGKALGVDAPLDDNGRPDPAAVGAKVYEELKAEVQAEMDAEMDAALAEMQNELAEAQRQRQEAEAKAAEDRQRQEAEIKKLQDSLEVAQATVAELEARPADNAEANERLAEELLKARERVEDLRERLAEAKAKAREERAVGIAIGREEGRAEADAEWRARQPEAQLERFEMWLMGERHAEGLQGLPSVEQVARKFIDGKRWDADRFRAFVAQLFPALDPHILQDAVDRVSGMMLNRAQAAQSRAVRKLLDRLRQRSKDPKADSRFSTFFEYLSKAAKYGVLDERLFIDAFAASWGLNGLNPAIIANLRTQWQAIQNSGDYGMKRETAERKFNETINRLAPAQSWLNFIFSNYQSRVLSSVSSMINQFSALGRLLTGMSAIQRTHQAGLITSPQVMLSEWWADVGGLLQNAPLMLTALRGESLGHLPPELAHGHMPNEQRTSLITSNDRLRVGKWRASSGATQVAKMVEFWTWRTIRAAEGLTGITDSQGHFRLALTNHYRAQGMSAKDARAQALKDIASNPTERAAAEQQARQEQAAAEIGGLGKPEQESVIRRRVEEIIAASIDARNSGKAVARAEMLTAHAQFKTMPTGVAGYAVSSAMSKLAPGSRGVMRFWLLFGRFLGHTVDVSLGYMPVAHLANKKVVQGSRQEKIILETFGSLEAYQRNVDGKALSAVGLTLGTGLLAALAMAMRDDEDDEPFFTITGSAPGNDRDVKDALLATGKWGEQQVRIGGVPVLGYGQLPELAPVLGVIGNLLDAARFAKVLHQRDAEDGEMDTGKRQADASAVGLAIGKDYLMAPIKRSTYRQWAELLSSSMNATSTGQEESWLQRLGSVATKPVEGMTRVPVMVDADKLLKRAEGGRQPDGFAESVLRRLPFAESVFGVGVETFNAYGERTPAWDVISAFPSQPDFSDKATAAARINTETGTRRGLPGEPTLPNHPNGTVREATAEEMSRYFEVSGRLYTESLLKNEAAIRRAHETGGQAAAQKIVGNISRKANERAKDELFGE